MIEKKYEAIVIGSGHAGCEAGLALARMGHKTLILTMNLDSIAFLACNPSIGGTAKGQLVGEIDSLGGEMAINADKAMLQLRVLNKGKGPAVQSLRAQVDKNKYHTEMKKTLEKEKNIDLLQSEVSKILTENGKIVGVKTTYNEIFLSKVVIVCTGVYLKARIIMGEFEKNTGPNGFEPANKLTESLISLGVKINRLKTGTPARIDGTTIDYSKFEIQQGDELNRSFSYINLKDAKNTHSCYLGYTSLETKEIIEKNINLAPMFNGFVTGVGPRYCPAIETKIMRFNDKEKHQLFLEPESADTKEIYIQGISTSMPVDIQRQIYASIPGLENAKIMRFAYAIEYDAIDAQQLFPTLQLKTVEGLYFAGQVNGTSGYEEAGAQGIIAGINGARYIENKEPLILKRNQAYIGVLIDDLVTKSITEPYRMMTSRAEHRLVLRQDNCDIRLTELGRGIGLVTNKRYKIFNKKKEQIEQVYRLLDVYYSPEKVKSLFIRKNETLPKSGISLKDMLKRTNITIFDLKQEFNIFENISDSVLEYVETEVKYEGYIKRENEIINKNKAQENLVLPSDIDYLKLSGLRLEARQKLNEIRPVTLGQASRIDGVSPADINVLIIYLKLRGEN